MHSYLRPVGFSRYTNKVRINKLIDKVMESPDYKLELMVTTEETVFEFRKEFAQNMGIAVHGIVNEKQEYEVEYYFPYFGGGRIIIEEDVAIEKNVFSSSYYGACEDAQLGITLIFFLQNGIQYLERSMEGIRPFSYIPIILSALALSGKILLPVMKTQEDIKRDRAEIIGRNKLISAARMGDEEAMESLTVADLDTFAKISGRIRKEDVLSIVDSSFMPYGVSCDRYSIVGNIKEVKKTQNTISKEEIYQLTVDCNGLTFEVAINEADLMGEPKVNRRFKGVIWMQGIICFT